MTVAGVAPRAVVEPGSADDLAGCVAELYARDAAFAFAGGGTQLELGNAPRALDTLVKTTACARVIDYAPQDQTITVEAGMTLSAAAEVLARERQFLAIDAADPERVTVGGAIATNLYGSRRLRYGSIKDTIVGVEIVRPDGTRARGGGKVVKNVAGFDMPKLMVGSLGTLGGIVSATFRVYPLPECRAAIVYGAVGGAQVAQIGEQLIAEALVPTAVAAYAVGADRYDCRVTFEGFVRGVEEQMDVARAIGSRLGCEVDAPGVVAADEAPHRAAAYETRERLVRAGSAWHVQISAAPTALARFLASAPLPPDARCVVYPLLGSALVAADALDPATVTRWRADLGHGSVVVHVMPAHARAALDAWGEPPAAAFAIMRRLKSNFDPKGLCNAGRFVGGL
jgi:glycolate oxidase FAD binding subunit